MINLVLVYSPLETNIIAVPCYIFSLFMLWDCDVSNNLVYWTLPGNTAEQLAVDYGKESGDFY